MGSGPSAAASPGDSDPPSNVACPLGAGWCAARSGKCRAKYEWNGAAIQELADLVGFGSAINGTGETTGWSWRDPFDPERQPTAFRYSDADGFVDLGTFGGSGSYAYGINAAARIATCRSRAR